jgi:hypothetical protein
VTKSLRGTGVDPLYSVRVTKVKDIPGASTRPRYDSPII